MRMGHATCGSGALSDLRRTAPARGPCVEDAARDCNSDYVQAACCQHLAIAEAATCHLHGFRFIYNTRADEKEHRWEY